MKSFFFVIALAHSLVAQAQWNSDLESVEKLLFDLKLNTAEHKLSQIKKSQVQNPIFLYQEASLAFLKALCDDTESQTEEAIKLIGKKIEDIEDLSQNTDYKLLALGELYVLRGVLKERLGQTLKSSLDLYSAYNVLKSAKKNYPNHPIFQMYWGVVQATIGSLPQNYQSYLKVMGFKGDVDEGLSLIEKNFKIIMANPKYVYYQKRASINFAITYNQLSDDKNFDLESRGVRVKGLPIFELGMAKICFEQNRAAKALEYLESYEKHTNIYRFHYFYYLKAKVQLAAGHPKTDEFFFTFLNQYKGNNFKKASHRYLAWFYFIQNENTLSEKHRKLAISEGKTLIWSDKSALKDVNEPFNKTLLLARIKYDGGFYAEALEILKASEKTCCSSNSDQVEWNYRMGRVYQAQKKRKNASLYYKNAIDIHENLDFNVGNSALQIALMAEDDSDTTTAMKYYNLCLSYNGFRYQEGVHQKAKAGLSRLKN